MRSIPKGNTPAKSALAAAAAEALKSNVTPKVSGAGAHGHALAVKIWEASQSEGAQWARYFTDIVTGSDAEDRKELRSYLSAKRAGLAELTKTSGIRSNLVRISEAFTVSKAADDGMTMQDCADAYNEKGIGDERTAAQMPHAWIVQFARAYHKKAKEQRGTKTAQGNRPSFTPEQKLARYIVSNFAVKDLKKVVAVVENLAETVKGKKDVEKIMAPLVRAKAEETNVVPMPAPTKGKSPAASRKAA